MRAWLCLLFAAIPFAACVGAPPAPCVYGDERTSASATPTVTGYVRNGPVETVEKVSGHFYTPQANPPGERLFQDERAWNAFVRERHGSVHGQFRINFACDFVAAVQLAEEATRGHAVHIHSVVLVEGVYRIGYDTVAPGPGCAPQREAVRPFHMVRIERASEGPIAAEFHHEKARTLDCLEPSDPTTNGSPHPFEVALDGTDAWPGPYSQHFEELLVVPFWTDDDWRDHEALFDSRYGYRRLEQGHPGVDFNDSFVVLVSTAYRPSLGYDLEVRGVEYGDASFLIDVKERAPGERCGVAGAVSAPYMFVAVERVDEASHPVQVRYEVERPPC